MPRQLLTWSDTIKGTYPQRLPEPLHKTAMTYSYLHQVNMDSLNQVIENAELRARLSAKLSKTYSDDDQDSFKTPTASVLIPMLLPSSSLLPLGEIKILLTKRTANLSSHKGELVFPGGRLEPGETYAEAAIRETSEEVGLRSVTVLGTLGSHTTVQNTSFVAVVGVVEDIENLSPSVSEVEKVLLPSVAQLISAENYHEEQWHFAKNVTRSMHFFEVADELCWGATASLLAQFLELLLHL